VPNGPGRGAEFRVVLPCLHDVNGPTVSGETGASPIAAVVSRRVLVVDDNADIAETTALLLEMSGHVVRAAADGMQALACAAEFLPEIVLLDSVLPAYGYEVARRLRDAGNTRAR
jgi:PleD family two-component response regulator